MKGKVSILNRKYPFELNDHPVKEGLIAFAIVFLILFLLQPFGISEYAGNKFLVSLAFGFVTFVCCLAMDYCIEVPLHEHVKTWRIWHQALTVFVEILIIGICNFLIACILFQYPVERLACLEMVYFTIIIGLIYTALSTSLSYQKYMRKRLDALLEKTTQEQEGVSVTLHDHRVRGNDLSLSLNDLLYIEAQKNNVVVVYVSDGQVARNEIQSTLASVLNDLKDYPNIFQCHRSFVVNLNSITSAKGNSNGYTLELDGGLATVPVSRSFVPKLKSFII
ncbi:MAG: LytTR family transcriptional regulator DNA-binding domain-containing protein [Bacteroidales bacterium]|nr:LytTR family transcriptional regulator DNA-binding domain-containing protein [Bacteroidales bacterium]